MLCFQLSPQHFRAELYFKAIALCDAQALNQHTRVWFLTHPVCLILSEALSCLIKSASPRSAEAPLATNLIKKALVNKILIIWIQTRSISSRYRGHGWKMRGVGHKEPQKGKKNGWKLHSSAGVTSRRAGHFKQEQQGSNQDMLILWFHVPEMTASSQYFSKFTLLSVSAAGGTGHGNPIRNRIPCRELLSLWPSQILCTPSIPKLSWVQPLSTFQH